jgi:hypothetical protein
MINGAFSSLIGKYLINPLDGIGETRVKSALVFDSEYLQYWFCRVRSYDSNSFAGELPRFFVRK